jgi:hypothetical protein
LTRLMFLNQTMHPPWRFVDTSNTCWMIVEEPYKTLTRLMFLNQTMHPLWRLMKMSNTCSKIIKEPWKPW